MKASGPPGAGHEPESHRLADDDDEDAHGPGPGPERGSRAEPGAEEGAEAQVDAENFSGARP
jgi:hypothetical protein